uniref:Moricin n=1 Tax=Helicoverpa armigera TaxID=29058 RepID=E5D606_HELAM|nr:moricin [Helicoverpa armigera]
MKFTKVLVIFIVVIALLVPSEAAPGKIPVGAIKKAGRAIGKGLRAINIASTAHDVYTFFKPKKRH